jgi:hypothetical protein
MNIEDVVLIIRGQNLQLLTLTLICLVSHVRLRGKVFVVESYFSQSAGWNLVS